ncbi:MAG TPA: hypothetical protein VGL58_11660 [Caulobacteraceae bacterium]
MAGFSAADAALTGFRIVWEKPAAVAVWAVAQFAMTLGLSLFIAVTAGPAFDRMMQMGFSLNAADMEQVIDLGRQLAPTYVAVLSALLVFYAVLWGAMNRAVLRPGASAFGYLRLSADELRQLGLLLVLAGLAFGLYVAVSFAAFAVGAVLESLMGPAGLSLMLALWIVGEAAAFIFFGVRLSLVSAQTFSTRHIDLAGAWRLTRGRFWPLLGTYAVAFALVLVVIALSWAIAIAAAAILGGGVGALGGLFQGGVGTMAMILSPGRLAYVAVSSVGSALGFPVTMAPPAAVYRALDSGRAGSRVFE